MQRRSNLLFAGAMLAALAVLGVAQAMLERAAAEQAGVEAPRIRGGSAVAQATPQPLGAGQRHRRLGRRSGCRLDHQSRVGHARRQREGAGAENGRMLHGRAAGARLRRLGQPRAALGRPGTGYDWPASNHGIFVDHLGNVWIGGNGPGDSHIVKFTKDGKFLAQYGKPERAARRGRRARDSRPLPAAATTRPTSAGWRRSSSIQRRTKRLSPTAISTSASPCSTARPAR